jgi:hypothetical protein
MIIQTALLPHKHVQFSESTLAIAGSIRQMVAEPRSVDELWSLINHNAEDSSRTPSFTQVVLAIDVLFAIKQIAATPDGRVFRVDQGQGSST